MLTSIQVAVKVNDGDGSISPINGSKQGKSDGVVAAESNDARKGLALFRRSSLIGIGGRTPGEDVEMTFFNLVQSPSVVISSISRSAPQHHTGNRLWSKTHEVTGISPQSRTVAQLLNGFVFKGTL